MSTVPSIVVDGNDLTAWLQDRSMSVRRNSLDATFIDEDGALTAIPALGDVVVLDEPAWAGVINSVVSTGWRGNVPFYKIRATNADPLPDDGPAPFNLADTGSRYSSPAGFKDLEVTRILQDAVEEVRSRCIIFKEGVTWGMEIDITSVVEGYSAETFTVMEMVVDWPIDDGATYTLDLGLGVYADAVSGGPPGDEGTPDDPWLSPPTLEDELCRIAEDCAPGGGGGGSTAPADRVTADCDAPARTGVELRNGPDTSWVPTSAGSGDNDVGSWVYYNVAYTVCGCPIGGGGWVGYHDEEQWYEFSTPTDDPSFLGMTVSVDATGLTHNQAGGYVGGFILRWYNGDQDSTKFGYGVPVGSLGDGGTAEVYIPRNLITWADHGCLIIAPDWTCERGAFYCNNTASFIGTRDDGRGNSGSYEDFVVGNACTVAFDTGTTGDSGWVAGYGAVDGVNTAFVLSGWDGTSAVVYEVNGLPGTVVDLDTGTSTATVDVPPPSESFALFRYGVAT